MKKIEGMGLRPEPRSSSASQRAGKTRYSRRVLALIGLAGLGWGLFAGCDSGGVPAADLDIDMSPRPIASTGSTCTEGEARECGATLGEHDGVVTCYEGLQTCEGGRWGACVGSSIVDRPPPTDEVSKRLLAYGSVANCSANPCDPYCQGYNEVPGSPLVAGEGLTSGFSWQTGSSSNSNAETASGTSQPCTSGLDCQFNQHCDSVLTESACGHSKCATGSALVPACDDCVSLVCASNPACCQRGWTCAHDVCTTGTKLDAACDNGNPAGSCVAKVCAKDSTCCSGSWTDNCVARAQIECGVSCGACGLDEIKIGSSCYYRNTTNKSWSDARTACQSRGTGWDLATINTSSENTSIAGYISDDTWIGYQKPSGTWKWASGSSSTYTRWNSYQPNQSGAACARMQTGGGWNDTSCSSTYDSFCEGPAASTGTSPSWTQACVDAVKSKCDATCGAGSPPAETGKCKAWVPGETDATCTGKADLALGVPCDSGVVPVCNHGKSAAPAGVTVAYYASSQAFACSPTATPKGTCPATTEAIEPGNCVNVTCPTTGAGALADGDRLVVNRTAAVSECSCLDNWSVYGAGVSCAAPTCQGTSTESTFKPVRMFMVVDRSYSMVCHPPSYPSSCFGENGTTCKCTSGRWNGATSALKSFFQSASSAGVGVAMDFFPLASSTGNDGCAGSAVALPSPSSITSTACSASPCKNPLVPLGYLTADASPTDTQEKSLVTALTSSPVNPPNSSSASTPSYPALDGALQWAVEQQAAKPNETFIVVFVTDGEPSACLKSGESMGSTPQTNAALVNLAKAAYQNHGVRTYTLGMEGSSVTVLDQIAAAGGTTKSYVVGGSNASDIATSFTAALTAISLTGASCTLPYTPSDDADPANAQVTYTSGTTTTVLTRRASAAACTSAGGWYFDNDTAPTKATLCPTSCTTVQADKNASLKMSVPCAAELEPAVYTQKYETACDEDQVPLWQFLAYDTTNKDGGTVQFRVRAARTTAELATATWITAKTATQTDPDCKPGLTGCPVDLAALLGGLNNAPHLELEMTVAPTSLGKTPSLDNWQVTFTCPYAQ